MSITTGIFTICMCTLGDGDRSIINRNYFMDEQRRISRGNPKEESNFKDGWMIAEDKKAKEDNRESCVVA